MYILLRSHLSMCIFSCSFVSFGKCQNTVDVRYAYQCVCAFHTQALYCFFEYSFFSHSIIAFLLALNKFIASVYTIVVLLLDLCVLRRSCREF